jgi:hypothetical protein
VLKPNYKSNLLLSNICDLGFLEWVWSLVNKVELVVVEDDEQIDDYEKQTQKE